MDNQDLIDKINSIINDLSVPVSASEAAAGWTAANKKQFHDCFIELKQELQAGKVPPRASISRAMDFAGVIDGDILERAAAVSNELNRRSGKSL